MSNEKIVIGVAVDASEAQDGLKRVEQASQQSAQKIKDSFKGAGDGIGSVGAGGEEAASKVDRSTKSIIGSIQRATAQLESGGRAGSKYYEILANQRGVPLDALRPYIDQLKKVEQAQGSLGISARETANAMRSVPAQFTDIITSLQGGQAPLTVLLQQGGQLKDMFGGAGNAARALGSYVIGLVNPYTILGGVLGAVVLGYAKGSKEASEFTKSIVLTGNAAATSTNELIQITEKLNMIGAGSKGLIAESLNTLVSSGRISSGVLEEATLAAVGAQKNLGIAVADTAKQYANLAKAPAAGLLELVATNQGLTIEIYRQVKALEDQGRASEAAILAQSSYSKVLLDQKADVEKTLGTFERGWNAVKDATAGAVDKILDIGRASSNIEQLQPLLAERRRLTASKANLGTSEDDRFNRGVIDSELLAINARIKALVADEKATVLAAAAQDTANKKKLASVEVEKLLQSALTKTELKKKAIANAEMQMAIAGTKEEDRKKILADIEEKFADKSIKNLNAQSIARENYANIAKRAAESEKKALEDIQRSIVSFKAPNTLKDISAEFDKQTSAFVRVNAGLEEYAAGLQAQNELAQLEMSLLGESSTARGIIIEQYKIELALQKEIRKIKSEIKNAGEAQVLIDQATANAQVEKSQAAIKVQQSEWNKFYGDIYNGLTDSLYRGFESGKGFFKSFWDGVKNLFKTTVLKLAVQGVMTGILGGVAGTAGAASLPTALSSGANLVSVGKSIYDGFSLAASAGAGVTTIGNLLGSSAISAFGAGMGLSSSAAGAAASAYGAAGMGGTASAISAGSMVGAALPWVAGAALLYKGLSMGDKQLGGQTVTGTLGTDNFMRNQSWTQSGGFLRSDRSGVWSYGLKDSTAIQDGKAYVDTASLTSDKALLATLNSAYDVFKSTTVDFAKTLGINADEILKRNDAISFVIGKTDQETSDAMNAAFKSVADSMATSLIPNIKNLQKEGETASSALARVATNFGGVNAIFKDLNLTLFKSGEAGIKAASSFVDLFGGLENLQAASTSYFENFYSEEERLKVGREKLAEELRKAGAGEITTREGFRAAVTNADRSGNSEQLAALLKLNSAFAQLYPVIDDTAEAARKAREETDAANLAAQKQQAILSERASLQDELNRLTLTEAQLLALRRSALDESNRDIFDAIEVAKQKKTVDDQLLAAAQADAQIRQQAADALASANLSIQQQIDELVNAGLTLEQQRAKELIGLDASTVALKERLFALQDEAAAAQAAKQAADALLSVNLSVQQQIDQLVNAGLTLEQQRAKELIGLDASTVALKERLFALQDEAAAAAKAADLKLAMAERQAQADREAQSQYQSWVSDLKSAFSRESGILKDVIGQFTDLAQSMKEYAESLSTGPAALLSPEAQYLADKAKFESISALAKTGDKDALAQVRAVSDKFLESSRRYNASSQAYFDDLNKVKQSTLDASVAAYAQVDVASLQLNQLEQLVGRSIDINESVRTVAEILSGAMSGSASGKEQTAVMGYASTVKRDAENLGGIDALLAGAQSGDPYGRLNLQKMLARWNSMGLKDSDIDTIFGSGWIKKLTESLNIPANLFGDQINFDKYIKSNMQQISPFSNGAAGVGSLFANGPAPELFNNSPSIRPSASSQLIGSSAPTNEAKISTLLEQQNSQLSDILRQLKIGDGKNVEKLSAIAQGFAKIKEASDFARAKVGQT